MKTHLVWFALPKGRKVVVAQCWTARGASRASNRFVPLLSHLPPGATLVSS
jgi:hypothetical protein